MKLAQAEFPLKRKSPENCHDPRNIRVARLNREDDDLAGLVIDQNGKCHEVEDAKNTTLAVPFIRL